MNQAGAKTRGVDLNLTANIKDGANSWVANFDGTYTSSYKSRFSASDPWTELVGSFGDAIYGYDLHVRWKHQASLTWSRGDWSVTGVQAFTGHYRDEVDGFGSGDLAQRADLGQELHALPPVGHLHGLQGHQRDLRCEEPVRHQAVLQRPQRGQRGGRAVGMAGGRPRMRSFTLRVNHKF
jgi:hypothetical protein